MNKKFIITSIPTGTTPWFDDFVLQLKKQYKQKLRNQKLKRILINYEKI